MLLIAFICAISLFINSKKNNEKENDNSKNINKIIYTNYYSEKENIDFKSLRKRSSFDETNRLFNNK